MCVCAHSLLRAGVVVLVSLCLDPLATDALDGGAERPFENLVGRGFGVSSVRDSHRDQIDAFDARLQRGDPRSCVGVHLAEHGKYRLVFFSQCCLTSMLPERGECKSELMSCYSRLRA